MVIGENRLTLPQRVDAVSSGAHPSGLGEMLVLDEEYSVPQLRMMIRVVEGMIGREIALDEWSQMG